MKKTENAENILALSLYTRLNVKWSTQPPIYCVSDVRLSDREPDYSPPPSSKVKKMWIFIYATLCVIMV